MTKLLRPILPASFTLPNIHGKRSQILFGLYYRSPSSGSLKHHIIGRESLSGQDGLFCAQNIPFQGLEICYILMDYVPGQTLSRCWEDLSTAERSSVIGQIRQYVQSWRRIRGTYIGSIGGGPCMDSIFSHSFQPCQRSYGPYTTRQAFNEGVVSALRNSRLNESQINHELEQKVLQTVGEAIVFTHGDLNQGNIIVSDNKVTIVDWGEAGYSIEEREFTEAKMKAGYCSDWEHCISDMVPDFTPQFEFWSEVINEMRLFAGI